ncbi:MAG: AAA family ATPase [bacterium]|nr:AAA family ATPase [bacterium]
MPLRQLERAHWKSIEALDLELGPLTVIVGPNGSGKSNFIDALRFASGPWLAGEEATWTHAGQEEPAYRYSRNGRGKVEWMERGRRDQLSFTRPAHPTRSQRIVVARTEHGPPVAPHFMQSIECLLRSRNAT